MNLNTITDVKRPASVEEIGAWRDGYSYLAGGTWLFSEPQVAVDTLIDLHALGWTPLAATADGLDIAATCRIEDLHAFKGPAEWLAVPLFRDCINAFLMSFKIWHAATVGGNICLGLPAGPMTSLCAALDGLAVLWGPAGAQRRVPVAELVTGVRRTALAPGEVLRAIRIPASSLRARTAFRRIALTREGRSGAVLIGRLDQDGRFVLTVTAATERPCRLAFAAPPDPSGLRAALAGIDCWYDDPHGAPDWRAHVSGLLAAEILAELT